MALNGGGQFFSCSVVVLSIAKLATSAIASSPGLPGDEASMPRPACEHVDALYDRERTLGYREQLASYLLLVYVTGPPSYVRTCIEIDRTYRESA